MQQKVYVSDPGRGKVAEDLIGAIIAMFAAAFALVWASSHQEFFALVLVAFVIVNVVGWMLIVRRIKPIIEASRTQLHSTNKLFRLEQLSLIEAHMTGKWQVYRFSIMLFIALLSVLVYYSMPVRYSLAALVASLPFGISADAANNLLPPFFYLLFVAVANRGYGSNEKTYALC